MQSQRGWGRSGLEGVAWAGTPASPSVWSLPLPEVRAGHALRLPTPACTAPPPALRPARSLSGPLCPHFTWPGCSFLPGGGQRTAVWVAPPVPQRSAWGSGGCGAVGGGCGVKGQAQRRPAAGSMAVCSLAYSLSPPAVRTEHGSCAETCLLHRADCAFGVRSPWSRLHQSRVDAQLGRG